MTALLLVALLTAAPAALPPELAAIATQMKSVTTLQAHVRQDKVLAVFAETMTSEGSLAFARPRSLWLDFGGTDGTTLVVNGDAMALRYKALARTERYSLSRDTRAKAIAEHIFLLLEADPAALATVYALTVTSKAPVAVQLRPRAAALAAIITEIDAQFDGRGLVRRMVIHEAGGDLTRWTFTDVQTNVQLPADRFALP
ncbi:MAG: outer membrane lipoprotein carrier protein LolA [Myxococcota bacterium]